MVYAAAEQRDEALKIFELETVAHKTDRVPMVPALFGMKLAVRDGPAV